MWNNLDGLAANNAGILSFQIQKRRDSRLPSIQVFFFDIRMGIWLIALITHKMLPWTTFLQKTIDYFLQKKYCFVYHSETVDDSERVLGRVITIYYDDNF